MLRPVLIVGAVGVGGYLAWQVIWAVVLPMLGALLGFVWVAVKIALLVGLAFLVYRMFKKSIANKQEATP
jgi:hypothetical protein